MGQQRCAAHDNQLEQQEDERVAQQDTRATDAMRHVTTNWHNERTRGWYNRTG